MVRPPKWRCHAGQLQLGQVAGSDEFGAPDAVGGETDLVAHRRLRAPFVQPLLFLVAAPAEFRSTAGPATHRFKDGRHRMRDGQRSTARETFRLNSAYEASSGFARTRYRLPSSKEVPFL